MHYEDVRVSEDLSGALREAYELPPRRCETLGELAIVAKRGTPPLEHFASEEPTRHEIVANDKAYYAPCFLDALMFPFLLGGERVEVRSKSPVDGEEVEVIVTEEGVEPYPRGAVTSYGAPRTGGGFASRYLNAFSSREEYERWAHETAEAVTLVLSIEDAFAFARDLITGGRKMPGRETMARSRGSGREGDDVTEGARTS